MARDIIFGAQFTETKLGKTGLTVTFNVYRVTLADLTTSQTVTNGSATAVGQGLYIYRVASADLQTYYYFAVASTATTTVDQREIPAVHLDYMDRSASVQAGTGDAFARLGAPAGASTAADIAAAKADTAAIKTHVDLALPAAEPGDFGGLADFNTVTTYGNNVSIILDRIGSFTGSGVNTVLGFFRALMRSDATIPSDVGGTYAATDSTQAINAAIPTAATVADAVWDEATSGHQTAGTTGKALTDAAAGGGGGGGSTYAVMGMYVKIGETDDTFISAGEGDTVEVALFFRDASNQAVVIPDVDTNVMLDSGNNEVGTVTLTDSKLEVGWLYYTLEIPASGNMPTRLRVQFDTGSGATHRRDVNIKVTA